MESVTPALAAAAVAAFLVGGVSPAVLLARWKGSDLRSAGSGNPGATNAGRVLGRRWGVLVGVVDVLKGLVPTVLALVGLGLLGGLAVGLAVVLGHMFSPFLGFRGGKGVATACGAILAVHPLVAVAALAVFALSVPVVRYVGRAAVVACVALEAAGALQIAGLSLPGGAGTGTGETRVVGWWLVAIAVLVLLRHRPNVSAWARPGGRSR